MTPLQFEAAYGPLWKELRAALDLAEGVRPLPQPGSPGAREARPALEGARLSALYRRACEHLALAQARSYPLHLTHRLEMLTQRAHQLIYRRRDDGVARLKKLALVDFPQSVRAHRGYLLASFLLFVLPLLAVGWACYRDPGFILHLVDAQQAHQYEAMYDQKGGAIGRLRSADTDWRMFGFYVMHNIGIGFQCFASGIFGGLGSAFFLVFNGLSIGGIAGYLTARGHGENFYAFVVTHSAFELTAIVLSGAAGLRLGAALLAPGRRTRLDALKQASQGAITVVYGAVAMLVGAAAIEAFWSSAAWVSPLVKYGAGAACWVLVIAYLGWQGRPMRATHAAASQGVPRDAD